MVIQFDEQIFLDKYKELTPKEGFVESQNIIDNLYTENFENRCLPGFYKVFLALDVGNDYHWWRQDNNKLWSHKPGSTEISNVDGNKKKIINPLKSSRKFTSRNYDKPCFYACIQSDLSRTLDEIILNKNIIIYYGIKSLFT